MAANKWQLAWLCMWNISKPLTQCFKLLKVCWSVDGAFGHLGLSADWLVRSTLWGWTAQNYLGYMYTDHICAHSRVTIFRNMPKYNIHSLCSHTPEYTSFNQVKVTDTLDLILLGMFLKRPYAKWINVMCSHEQTLPIKTILPQNNPFFLFQT